ncbi:unnamed protein product, partial [Brenthis ino]
MTLVSHENSTLNHTYARWIDQELDHFSSKENRKWKMRYLQRIDLWRPGGPIYLFVGGESSVSPIWASAGMTYELAKETNGAIYISEHRYYGKSKPFNNTNVENFKFLTARQALADLEHLLKYIKQQPQFKYSKIVVIGGSYAGNLAVWMRLFYPDVVDAVISSSAPVLAKKNFHEYLEKVNTVYELFGTQDCLDTIKQIFRRYDMLLQSAEGIKQLKSEENICENCNLTIPENQQTFFSNKVNEYMTNAQYGNPDKIKNHCKRLNDSLRIRSDDDGESKKCHNYDFQEMINDEELQKEENEWIITWYYQICTEFGYFTTTNSNKQPFTSNIPLSYYVKICTALFGPEFDEKRIDDGIEAVNQLYGGLKPNVTKVVFTNGDIDPWSTLSILEDLSYKAPAVIIPSVSHCRDIVSNKKNDSEELREARKYIKYLVKDWIGAKDNYKLKLIDHHVIVSKG